MVSIENLHKKFGKNQVLKGVDLSINEGGIFAVLGPNGSGKTTLIKSVLGMVILFPLLILIAGIILLRLKRPVFFKQKRVGRHSKLFTSYS